jgi:hypothetical protein
MGHPKRFSLQFHESQHETQFDGVGKIVSD